MNKLAGILVSAIAAVAALASSPVHADEAHPWDAEAPALYNPVTRSTTTTGDVVVQLKAPAGSWGIRQSARRLDAQVDGITIRTGGDCSTADLCVTVEVAHYDEAAMLQLSQGYLTAWGALTTWPDYRTGAIYLNPAVAMGRKYRRYSAAHELGHVLGLGHHAQPGLMSGPTPGLLLSDAEADVLEAWYAAQ